MTIDGVSYPDIGLKLKGSASYDTMDGKPAFIVDMNEWELGTKFRGLGAFKLHNGNVLDPTRVRDHISYKLARDLGLVAPRVGWAEVYCSGVYYGIYMIIEKHDDTMIESRRPGDEELGMIFEPNETEAGGWGGDFGSGNIQFNYETGPDPLPAAAADSLNTIDALVQGAATDERVEALWDVTDKDMILAYMAWEAVIGHTDGYKAPNNWRVYVNGTTNRVELSPSGAEWTWDSTVDLWYFGGRVANWCISNTQCKHDYAEKVLEVADRVEALGLLDEFVAQSEFLDPLIDADPRYNSWETPDAARLSTVQHLTENPGRARTQVYQTFPDLQP
jgi:spore coat protein CotH